ncbi:MAG: S49 family peptidase [Gammaproteobacteria bacterium]|nr:MAG: S49 family peptidase [Gammaproteobacteria bacterium]
MTDTNGQRPTTQDRSQTDKGWERNVIERLAFASLNEQRKARRWGIFFKAFFAAYLVLLLVLGLTAGIGEKPLTGEYTALVDLDGVISADSLASADNIISGLRGAFDSGPKGVILRTNSPGGSPVQASYINDEIRRLREKYPDIPVYAVITDVCASGCYYAVVSADKIYANKASIVGSIGVLMNGFGFVDGMKRLGIERRLFTAGKNKGFLDPFSPLSPKHRAYAQQLLDRIHQQFIRVVKEGRGDSLKETPETFTGLFWTGDEALQMGLVDALGSASYVAREVIGADKVVDFSFREGLFDRVSRRIGMVMARTLAAELAGRVPELR